MEIHRVCCRCYLLRSSAITSIRHAFQARLKRQIKATGRLTHTRRVCTSSTKFTDTSTVDDDEVSKLSKNASDWWDVFGEFHALHSMNRVRVPYIKKAVLKETDTTNATQASPLKHVNILDVGCGGGILSEALARLGATVTGIDASARNIHVAMSHSSLDPLLSKRLTYKCITAQELVEDGHEFDCVVSSEVIEHVTEKDSFIQAVSGLLKPGGSVVMTTLGQTTKSYLAAIVAAEYLTHMVTPGTHDWNKFITADDLNAMLSTYGLETQDVQGLCFNPLTYHWSFIDDPSVNYAIHAVKTLENSEENKTQDNNEENSDRKKSQENTNTN